MPLPLVSGYGLLHGALRCDTRSFPTDDSATGAAGVTIPMDMVMPRSVCAHMIPNSLENIGTPSPGWALYLKGCTAWTDPLYSPLYMYIYSKSGGVDKQVCLPLYSLTITLTPFVLAIMLLLLNGLY